MANDGQARGFPRQQGRPGPGSWQARPEAGTKLAIAFLAWVAGRVHHAVLHALLRPIVLYFYFARTPERHASRAFLMRALGRPVRECDVLRHFTSFARVSADRFYFLTGRTDSIDVRFIGSEEVQRVVDAGRPGIFLAAHFGSFEASRVIGPQLGGVDLRIVLDKSVSARLMDAMAAWNPALMTKIIHSEQGSAALGLAIAEALRSGAWVGILADRHRPDDRTEKCEFLGAPAAFPVGPYLVASAFRAPVIGMFCRLTGTGYEVHCEVLSEGVRIPRRRRSVELPALVARYAASLERHVRAVPFGWFNFHDFWADADA